MDRSLRILLVDDSVADSRLMREALTEVAVPYELRAVPDGVEALAFLQREGIYATAPAPDLVVTDLNMLRLNGLALLRIIKSDPTLHRLPVLILSTSTAPADIAAAYALHVNAYLAKPADLDAFVVTVQGLMQFWGTAVQFPPGPD